MPQVSAPSSPTSWPDHRPAAVTVPPWYAGLRISGHEVRTGLGLVLGLAAGGIPVGLLWLALAPRREFEVVDGGFRAVEPQSEALVGADGVLLILTGLLGVLAAGLVWWFVRIRGVSIVLGLAIGMLAAAITAWQTGEWLGSGSSEAQAAEIGAIVTPALQLRAIPVLVIGAFIATLGYLVVVSFAPSDDLTRRRPVSLNSGSRERSTETAEPEPRADVPVTSALGGADGTASPTSLPSDPRPATPGDPRL